MDAMMEATVRSLSARADDLRREWSSHPLFGFVVCDDFLPVQFAEEILAAYPQPDVEGWDQTTYTHQRKKFTRRSGFTGATARFFDLTADPEFRAIIGSITGIPNLLADPELVGGGLHQILRGGFLDVHVDFNLHPETKLHRRLNLLLYLNKDWKREYGGCLELWDMRTNTRLADIAPIFNRAVLFETNEASYHGHPVPLNCPQKVTRKSLAIYYYTETRDRVSPEHNTLYRQTTGLGGYAKTLASSLQAARERLGRGGVSAVAGRVVEAIQRRLRGLPPENR